MPVAPSIYAMAQRQQPDPVAGKKMGHLYPVTHVWDRSVPGEISKAYLQRVSTGLSFTEDVVKERCYSSLPYDKKYLLEAFDVSNIVTPPPKSRHLLGRHDPSLTVKRHLPCNLKPLRKKAAINAAKLHEGVVQKVATRRRGEEDEEEEISSVFLTDVDLDGGKTSEWDKHVVSILSQPTAEWIVHKHVSPGEQQDELAEALEQRYGAPSHTPELIRDSVSEEGMSVSGDVERKQEGAGKKWKKETETLLDRVRDLTEKKGLPTDPYCDDTGAAFYRLPAGIRRAHRQKQKQDDGAINRTARNVEVVPFLPPPPPSLRESLHPRVGNKVFETNNPFQQERLIGVQQVRGLEESDTEIVLETHNHYRKQLQETTPRDPATWFPQTTPRESAGRQSRKPTIGSRHWTSLPQLIQDVPLDHSNSGIHDGVKSADPNGQRKAMTNNTLLEIVNDWRAKWNLDMRYADATPDDLIRDMADIHVHIKLKAITTCARAAEYRPPPQPGIHLNKDKDGGSEMKLLPEELFVALECCLDDPTDQVKRAAAITLYTLERPVPKAEALLRQALREAVYVDRWAAAQCLAYYGECDSEVVGELIRQLLNSTNNIHRDQAGHLLAKLSENSTLVHSMLAEQLNSSSWRHRVMTCTILPKLQGNINKDIVNKLLYLMWNDWHKEVRKVAAQTLGRTGHGKAVHDELITKITRGTERSKLEALSKLGHLGIMTAKLLPPFLECFQSNYVSVRMEACIACSNLGIKEESVINRLIYLTTYDGIWKVKALALQALGKIGVVTQSIRECVLWAFRYEKVSGVRAEACHSIIALHMTDKDVIQCLQDRYLVEPSDVVKEEIIAALEMCAISPTEDMDMVTQIKNEVTKMCTRNNVCTRILLSEKKEAKQAHMSRLIYRAKKTAAISQEMSKATEAKEHMEAKEKTTLSVDVIATMSRASSREIAAADSEVQAITARPLSTSTTTESHTTASLSGKSRRTDKTATSKVTTTSTYAGSETGSDESAATSRRSTTSQLAAAVMAAASDKSERRRQHRSELVAGDYSEEILSGGDVGITITVDDTEKAADGKGVDDQQLVSVDAVSNVIAYFFQRYDNIGIPNDDDLARIWEQDPVGTDHFPATAEEKNEVMDVRVTLSPVEMGTGDAGHETPRTPVDNEAESAVFAEVVREDRQDTSGNHTPRSPDPSAPTAATGITDGEADVQEGGVQMSVDNERPQSKHDDVTAHDRGDMGEHAEVQDNSAEARDGDGYQVTAPDVIDQEADAPRNETTSEHLVGHQVAASYTTERQEEEAQQEAERNETEGHQEAELNKTEGHQEAEPNKTEGHQVAEPNKTEGHQAAEPNKTEEHQEAEPNKTEGRQAAEPTETDDHQETEPNNTDGHQETESIESGGHQEAEPKKTEGQQEAEPIETEGHQEADPNKTEGHQEAEPKKTEGHQEAAPVESEGHQEAEPNETDKDVDDEHRADPVNPDEALDTHRHEAGESDKAQ